MPVREPDFPETLGDVRVYVPLALDYEPQRGELARAVAHHGGSSARLRVRAGKCDCSSRQGLSPVGFVGSFARPFHSIHS